MKQRQFLGSAAAASTLKFVPYTDLALLDPRVSAFVTRNHAMMVFDTLFALDANGEAHPITRKQPIAEGGWSIFGSMRGSYDWYSRRAMPRCAETE